MHTPYQNARYVLSAGVMRDLPPPVQKEYALLGRSNVGKSTFINHVCANKTLARTSKTPGTTVCANLYAIDETVFWVDLPGYGFARKASDEKSRCSRLIRDYCEKRGSLAGIIWFVDCRHIDTDMDRQAYEWLACLKRPVLPLLTKADKLGHGQRQNRKTAFMRRFTAFEEPLLVSSRDQACRELFWERFTNWTRE
ncbi:MAG: ribosome biogenesis GTP-binding protein YsxC [Chitinispirillaceae bacterium]|nr:ribosome biogenesis GTP-binding protein YsxC [Chitinispirillaceae bacterium]